MNALTTHLKECDIFYQLTPMQLVWVAEICREASFNEGDTIFKENSRSKELYVILQGEVEILLGRPANGRGTKREIVKARLVRGQSFGEMALVDEGLRSAAARATQKDTRVLVIPREKLIMLCETYPPLGYRLMYNLAADLALKVRNMDFRQQE